MQTAKASRKQSSLSGKDRRQDIPRETHLHAWVTPAAACFLTLLEIGAGSLLWEEEPVSMATLSCFILTWKGRKKAG